MLRESVSACFKFDSQGSFLTLQFRYLWAYVMSTYILDCITIQPILAKPNSLIYKTKYM